MSDTACTLERRDDILVAYLYDDLEPAERPAFRAHLNHCLVCRAELDELREVRSDLAQWTPPAPARGLTFSTMPPRRARVWSALAEIPAWTQVAAALLVLGVAAGIANVNIRVDDRGFTVRTGWTGTAVTPPDVNQSPAAPAAAARQADAPWRADLAALEAALRSEMRNGGAGVRQAVVSGDAAGDNAALLRQMRGLIAASETNQRRELALRVGELARDFQVQRNADLQRIQGSFTVLESRTTGEIVKQQRVLNNLATWASQRQ
jgi:hypothetical protein